MTDSPEDTTTPPVPEPSGRPPVALLVALLVVFLEVVVLIVLGGLELASLSSARVVMGVTTALFFILWGAALGACSWGMWRRASAGRSVVVLGQLIQLGLAWSYRESTPGLAGALGATAAVALVGIFWPASLRWFEDEDAADD